jgi:hypothetical protein
MTAHLSRIQSAKKTSSKHGQTAGRTLESPAAEFFLPIQTP